MTFGAEKLQGDIKRRDAVRAHPRNQGYDSDDIVRLVEVRFFYDAPLAITIPTT
jgi:hypothetical protein